MSEKHPYEAVGLRPDGDCYTVEVLGCQTEDEGKRLARHYADLWRRSVNLYRVPFVHVGFRAMGRRPDAIHLPRGARSPRGEMSDNMTMAEWAAILWQLIFADDPAEIAQLEALLEGTQTEAVDEFIEQSSWSEDVPQLVGGKGTPAERREALRAAYRAQNAKGDS